MPDAFPITIYHNPDCGTSRNALAMIEAAGYAPRLVEYRIVGWDRPIVVTPKGTRLRRRSEAVLDLLDRMPSGFFKEDGEIVRR